MENIEIYFIVNPTTGKHYDTLDERFYSFAWERTFDSKKYLETLMVNNPEKFEGCIIQEK